MRGRECASKRKTKDGIKYFITKVKVQTKYAWDSDQ